MQLIPLEKAVKAINFNVSNLFARVFHRKTENI